MDSAEEQRRNGSSSVVVLKSRSIDFFLFLGLFATSVSFGAYFIVLLYTTTDYQSKSIAVQLFYPVIWLLLCAALAVPFKSIPRKIELCEDCMHIFGYLPFFAPISIPFNEITDFTAFVKNGTTVEDVESNGEVVTQLRIDQNGNRLHLFRSLGYLVNSRLFYRFLNWHRTNSKMTKCDIRVFSMQFPSMRPILVTEFLRSNNDPRKDRYLDTSSMDSSGTDMKVIRNSLDGDTFVPMLAVMAISLPLLVFLLLTEGSGFGRLGDALLVIALFCSVPFLGMKNAFTPREIELNGKQITVRCSRFVSPMTIELNETTSIEASVHGGSDSDRMEKGVASFVNLQVNHDGRWISRIGFLNTDARKEFVNYFIYMKQDDPQFPCAVKIYSISGMGKKTLIREY